MVEESNRSAAPAWNQGGQPYDEVSFGLSDALKHTAQRLWLQRGEHILDIGAGTGWTERDLVRSDAHITAVGIADELLNAAPDFSACVERRIKFELVDAEEQCRSELGPRIQPRSLLTMGSVASTEPYQLCCLRRFPGHLPHLGGNDAVAMMIRVQGPDQHVLDQYFWTHAL